MTAPLENSECCICLDNIVGFINRTTTECGHHFHCSCLIKNIAHNGFDCPLCRAILAEVPDEDEDEDEDDYEEVDEEEEYTLTSFRMFHQRLSGEEVEEEEEEEVENIPEVPKPTSQFIAQKLGEQGITLEDMVKCLLIEHEEYTEEEDIYERVSDEMYGKLRIIISNFTSETS